MALFRPKYRDLKTGEPKYSRVWWFKFSWRGELVRESTKHTNKRVATQIEAARKTALAKGEVGIVKRAAAPTLAAFAPRFEQAIETQCAEKPKTVGFYKAKLRQLLKHKPFADSKLNEIEEAMIDEYKNRRTKQESRRKKPFSPASVNRELATLRRLLRLAHEWKLMDRVPRIRMLRGERIREFVLSHQQEDLYLAATSGDLHEIAVLLLDTGLRIGEVLSLEWTAVRIDPAQGANYGFLTVRAKNSKNSRPRNVPLTERVSKMLVGKQTGSFSGLVFQRTNGQPLCQTWVNEQHRGVRDLLKLPTDFVPHSLRHTYGTRLGEAGADAFTIMRLMGHSTVTVSQRYVHPSPESMERAVSRLEAFNAVEAKKVVKESGKVKIESVAVF